MISSRTGKVTQLLESRQYCGLWTLVDTILLLLFGIVVCPLLFYRTHRSVGLELVGTSPLSYIYL